MDPFRLCVALGPLAAYCLLLGTINLMRRPILVSGPRDLAALGVAVTGLVVIGPMELFMPEAAVTRFGGYVWLLLLSFYGLTVSLAVLMSRPRLVIYNITTEQLRPILSEMVTKLDPQARWAGDSISLPIVGVQFHFDSFTPMRNVALVANGDKQSFDGWRRLETELETALRAARVPLNPRGISLLTLALLLLATCLIESLGDPQALAQGMREMLRI